MNNLKKFSRIFAVGVFITGVPLSGIAEIFKGETAGAGGPVHTMFVTFANQAAKGGVEIQVNAGQTLTKSMLKGAEGTIDFFSTVPVFSRTHGEPKSDVRQHQRRSRTI